MLLIAPTDRRKEGGRGDKKGRVNVAEGDEDEGTEGRPLVYVLCHGLSRFLSEGPRPGQTVSGGTAFLLRFLATVPPLLPWLDTLPKTRLTTGGDCSPTQRTCSVSNLMYTWATIWRPYGSRLPQIAFMIRGSLTWRTSSHRMFRIPASMTLLPDRSAASIAEARS